MYIEPCCCDKQLPALLREGIHFFQTNGDVTTPHFFSAVSSMAGKHVVLVMTGHLLEPDLLKVIHHYFERGWLEGVCLLYNGGADYTQCCQRNIQEHLGDYIDKVHFAADPMAYDSEMAFLGEKAVIIQSSCFAMEVVYGLTNHACYYGTNAKEIDAALDSVVAKLKLKAVIDGSKNEAIARVLGKQYLYVDEKK